jgi:hypothetical protein
MNTVLYKLCMYILLCVELNRRIFIHVLCSKESTFLGRYVQKSNLPDILSCEPLIPHLI